MPSRSITASTRPEPGGMITSICAPLAGHVDVEEHLDVVVGMVGRHRRHLHRAFTEWRREQRVE